MPDYKWFSYVSSLYVIVTNAVFFLLLWKKIFGIRRLSLAYRQMNAKGRLLTAIAGGLLVLINLFFLWYPAPPFGMRYLLSAVVILIYSLMVYGKESGKALFAISLFLNLHSLCCLISISLYNGVSGFLAGEPEFGSRSVEEIMKQIYTRVILGQMVLLLFYILLFFLMLKLLFRILKSGLNIGHQAVLVLSVLNIIGGMLGKMMVDLLQVKIDHEVFQLYVNRQEMLWELPLLAVLLFTGELSLIYFYQKYMELQRLKEQHFVEQQQVEAMKRRLKETEQFYGSIRQVRHEMKNHMTAIKGLVAGEQYQEVEHYIERLDTTIQELDYRYTTGNPVTDVILNDKYRKAQKLKIQWDVRFFYEAAFAIPAFDMGILLSNLLDNAIEACEKTEESNRYIKVDLYHNSPFLILTVENPYDGKLIWQEGSELPVSTKKEDKAKILPEHGLGLKNVKEIAERHLGGIQIQTQHNIFHITVLLQQVSEADGHKEF